MAKRTDGGKSLDQLLRLLTNRRRRYVLYCFRETDDDVLALDRVVDDVREREQRWNGRSTDADDGRTRTRTSLHHNHLPKLDDAGLIEYDARSRTVRYRSELSPMEWVDAERAELPHLRALLTSGVD